MIILKKALPRRTFLRGVGATVALPLLDAMIPSMTALAQSPAQPVRRLGFVYIPMGSDITRWTPPGESGPLNELSVTLSPLEAVKKHITVLSNNGVAHVGVIACEESVPEPWLIAEGFSAELDALLAAVSGSSDD